jgi:hypothetical protein
MEDLVALRDYDLKQNEINIIDLIVGMSATVIPYNASHTPRPSEAPTPVDITAVLPSSAATNDHSSPSEEAASHSELEQTTTRITFAGRTLDEYSSALQPELSEVMTALTQLAAIAPQWAPMSQRQVMGAPTDQLLNAPPQPTPPPIKLDEDAGQEEPGELTPPPTGMGEPLTEARLSSSLAHKLLPQVAPIDVPMPPISTLTVLVTGSGHALRFTLPPDTTIAFLKQAILTAKGAPTSRQVLSFQGKFMHGSGTLRDLNFTSNSNIDLTIKPATEIIQFFVTTLNGSPITMFDSLDTTGGQLKARLETKTGIPAAQQILIYTKEIQDLATLREISLPVKGIIHMSLLLPGGMKKAADMPTPPKSTLVTEDAPENTALNLLSKPLPRAPTPAQPQTTDTEMIQFFVQTLNGSSLTMRESRDTTGGELKARVQVRTGIPVNQQRLTYIKDIQDIATRREISLQENGTIHISLRLIGGMEKAVTIRQIRCDSIYVRCLGISVTHTPNRRG